MKGPLLYRPRPPLADHIDYFGCWEGEDAASAHISRALPRGAVTAIIGLGRRANLGFDKGFYAADGSTPLTVPHAFFAGAGVASYIIRIDPGYSVMTIHFHPAGALAFLGCPLGELEDALVGLTDVWGASADLLREQLVHASSARQRVALLETFLLDRMRHRNVGPQPCIASVMRSIELDPSMPVSTAHESTGLARKRFNALFRSEVGLSPKSYFRVRRLQAALRALNISTPGATIAADLGYYDQAHFVREFRSFAHMTPTQYSKRRSSMPGHVTLGALLR